MIKYITSIQNGRLRLAEIKVIRETDKTVFINGSKNLIDSFYLGNSFHKDSVGGYFVGGYFDDIHNAKAWLVMKGKEQIRQLELKIEDFEKQIDEVEKF